jgi:hypothetical protein
MMSIQNIHPSSHRGQDAAISAVLHAVGSHAHGSSTGIPLQIDEGRAFLAMGWAGGADMQQPLGPDRAMWHNPEPGIGNSFLKGEHDQQKASAAATGSHTNHPWFIQLD